jgi:uncharacterized RDD family membrane protein YckC
MTDSYFIFKNNQEEGPFTLEEVMETGLDVDTIVLSPLADDWQRASDLPEFFEYFEAKGIYFPTEDNLATFWWRLLAYLIDSVLISLLISIFASGYLLATIAAMEPDTTEAKIVRLKFNLVIFVISAIYNSVCEATPMRGSIGKKLCKLVVVDADGRGLSLGRALVRNFTKFLSSIVLGIGYLNILWSEHRQAWHDQIAKTYVITRNQ